MLLIRQHEPDVTLGRSIQASPELDNPDQQSTELLLEASDTDLQGPQMSDGCIDEANIESHPLILQEAERIAPYATMTPGMAAYRDLSETDLNKLIDQGDSAAMAVMAAIEKMRAWGADEQKAIPYLTGEAGSFVQIRPIPADQDDHYKRAAIWYYEAALHGRVLALIDAGNTLEMARQTPVELGWVTADEYADLSDREKTLMKPTHVYHALAHTIAPELRVIMGTETSQSATLAKAHPNLKFAQVVRTMYREFERTRMARGLPEISVPESHLPPIHELQVLLCKTAD